MNNHLVVRAAIVSVLALSAPGTAFAQSWTPGAEIVGQPVQVTTNGVTDTVVLNPGGQAQITTPAGHVVNAAWTAANNQLCLVNGAAQECWPYASPFQAGQPITATSTCNATSTWLAASTNAPPPPPAPTSAQKGERGR